VATHDLTLWAASLAAMASADLSGVIISALGVRSNPVPHPQPEMVAKSRKVKKPQLADGPLPCGPNDKELMWIYQVRYGEKVHVVIQRAALRSRLLAER